MFDVGRSGLLIKRLEGVKVNMKCVKWIKNYGLSI